MQFSTKKTVCEFIHNNLNLLVDGSIFMKNVGMTREGNLITLHRNIIIFRNPVTGVILRAQSGPLWFEPTPFPKGYLAPICITPHHIKMWCIQYAKNRVERPDFWQHWDHLNGWEDWLELMRHLPRPKSVWSRFDVLDGIYVGDIQAARLYEVIPAVRDHKLMINILSKRHFDNLMSC